MYWQFIEQIVTTSTGQRFRFSWDYHQADRSAGEYRDRWVLARVTEMS